MLSTLLTIAQYVLLIAAVVLFLAFFIPMIVTWVSWAVSVGYALLTTVPDWIIPVFMIGIVLALISLGVKVL